ncbi:PD-(D/E)XK nuclease family protein [Flavobacterium sp.]|uniref:PDDEXK-like family protein n=1 Tax=Flavobacterium sp. TaxID=239 RepID=UPI0028BE5DF6|nr:PD-(D/E)XK nuclease family protein [Flavobacterium sp.]
MIENVEIQLKELMLDEDFTSLQNLVNEEINLMDILRVSHKELQHSNFLAWFFNPNETHNIGDFALKEFIKIYFKENQFKNLGHETGLSVFDFVQLDFDDLEIRREYKNIDLVFLSEKNQFCIVIENKIYATESNGQLKKYRDIIEKEYPDFKHKIYIFLSLQEQQISESEQEFYVQLNYEHIIKLIEQVISSQRLKLADKTKFVFEQYLQTLKSMLNKNEEIEKVAQKLYKKYKSAFDLVLKYAVATDNSEIITKLKELIENEKTIRQFQSNNTYVRFQPNFLHDNIEKLRRNGLLLQTDDMSNNWVFLFEFNVRKTQVNFDCKIGAGDQSTREKLYNIYKKHKDVFTKVDKPLKSQWHHSFQKQILSPKDIQDFLNNDSVEELEKKITQRFRELIDKDLPKLISVLDYEINNSH